MALSRLSSRRVHATAAPQPASATHAGRTPALARAHPDLRTLAAADDPLAESRRGAATEPFPGDGSIGVRRRASSVEAASSVSTEGMQARIFVRQLAKDLERRSVSGVILGDREMRKAGFDPVLIAEIMFQRYEYRFVMRALAGGEVRASSAQFGQALALSVFDVNRLVYSLGLIGEDPFPASREPLSLLPGGEQNAHLRKLVLGAKRLTDFVDLREQVALWAELRMHPNNAGAEVLYRHLVQDIGLFHTNAMRVLRAYANALEKDQHSPMPHLPDCLAAQWLTGPGERELQAIRQAEPEQTEQFHRKLGRQFELVCKSFGLLTPTSTELLLLELPD